MLILILVVIAIVLALVLLLLFIILLRLLSRPKFSNIKLSILATINKSSTFFIFFAVAIFSVKFFILSCVTPFWFLNKVMECRYETERTIAEY